eukprot:TRINITY_DN10632_c0_g1_i1.p1 TRINITY_DN10632_c0_g1~~TRINITY_DN10632_c0_g1_i1.p1  ORF type:complete len:372 (-),score=91.67 TRINITY_DN10632_c0_g1_i1:2-1117(-)
MSKPCLLNRDQRVMSIQATAAGLSLLNAAGICDTVPLGVEQPSDALTESAEDIHSLLASVASLAARNATQDAHSKLVLKHLAAVNAALHLAKLKSVSCDITASGLSSSPFMPAVTITVKLTATAASVPDGFTLITRAQCGEESQLFTIPVPAIPAGRSWEVTCALKELSSSAAVTVTAILCPVVSVELSSPRGLPLLTKRFDILDLCVRASTGSALREVTAVAQARADGGAPRVMRVAVADDSAGDAVMKETLSGLDTPASCVAPTRIPFKISSSKHGGRIETAVQSVDLSTAAQAHSAVVSRIANRAVDVSGTSAFNAARARKLQQEVHNLRARWEQARGTAAEENIRVQTIDLYSQLRELSAHMLFHCK